MVISKDWETKIAIFQGKEVRKIIHNGEWWFSVVDIIQVLTDSSIPRRYWSDLKNKLIQEGYSELYEKIVQLKLMSADGKLYATDCGNTETILRLVQSVPSPKAEPFKRWLAKVGYERIQEIEDPELAIKRTRGLYKDKGYPDAWVEKRMQSIVIRNELTDEWQKRGANNQKDYQILNTEISKATFGLTPSQYKKHKGLKRENLRDHMGNLELVFNMLGEASAMEIHQNEDSQGVPKLKDDAKAGGDITGGARKKLEEKLGRPIVSKENFLILAKKKPKKLK